ncbi:MAG: hypothetical protein N2690_03400 [Rhodocyclaceae bacterium]|nr:hypothetical protein [Rhodocyclaceae bacterium]
MMNAKTEIRGNWPGQNKKPESTHRRRISRPVALEKLAISNDPPPTTTRPTTGGHYTPIFMELKMGQRIICPPDRARAIGKSLEEWLKKRGVPARVQTCAHYPADGMGGVWMLPAEDKP